MNLDKLKGHVPDNVIAQIPQVGEKFAINTPLRLAHFLSQCGHESGNFRVVNENLNYGAKGLLGLFKKYFPDEAKAKLYERKPEKIANLSYKKLAVKLLGNLTISGKVHLPSSVTSSGLLPTINCYDLNTNQLVSSTQPNAATGNYTLSNIEENTTLVVQQELKLQSLRVNGLKVVIG